MKPEYRYPLEEIDLSSAELWMAPLEVREGAFATLRAEDPIRFFEEFMPPGIPLEPGPGYWAITGPRKKKLRSGYVR